MSAAVGETHQTQSVMHPESEQGEKVIRFGERDKSMQWYQADPVNMDPHLRRLFVEYSGIPEDKVVEHVKKVVSKHQAYHLYTRY